MFRRFRTSGSKKASFMAGLVVAAASLLATGVFGVSHVFAAQDCDSNAIIYCGYTSASNFISKVNANHSNAAQSGGVPDHTDLKAIYAKAGLSSSEYNRFAGDALAGFVYRNGDVKLANGQLVASGAKTIGRSLALHQGGSGFFSWTVKDASGHDSTVYGNVPDKTYASGVTRLPALILFDGNGVMEFVVLDSCGNAGVATKVTPTYRCDHLNAVPDATNPEKINFSVNAPVTGTASVAKVVYDFGDGKTQEVTTPGSNNTYPTSHTYTSSGDFTTKVTVYVNLPGKVNGKANQKTIVPAGDCIKKITVTLPAFKCVQLDTAILSQEDKTKLQVKFTATASLTGNVTLTSGDITYGDGNSETGVKPDTAKTVTFTHTYTLPTDKDFSANASATLHFLADGKAVTAENACPALVSKTVSGPECKPNVPVGSPECKPPCTVGSSVPPQSKLCKPPELPNTGAGNTIAIFAAVVIGGFLVYRQLLFRKHKAAFMAAQQGTSPLPLGDPMSEQPLEDTPLAPKKHLSFRRKRHF